MRPGPLDDRWFIEIDGKAFGPYLMEEMTEFAEEGRINSDTPICPLGSHNWAVAEEVPELQRAFAAAAAAEVEKPPMPKKKVNPDKPPAAVENQEGAKNDEPLGNSVPSIKGAGISLGSSNEEVLKSSVAQLDAPGTSHEFSPKVPLKAPLLPPDADAESSKQTKSPLLATILSMIFPGLGQFYNRHHIKGVIMVFLGFVLWDASITFLLFLYIWAVVDALVTALGTQR